MTRESQRKKGETFLDEVCPILPCYTSFLFISLFNVSTSLIPNILVDIFPFKCFIFIASFSFSLQNEFIFSPYECKRITEFYLYNSANLCHFNPEFIQTGMYA